MRKLIDFIMFYIAVGAGMFAAAQNVPAPQIGLSGNVGVIGSPILNSGTFQMPSDADVTWSNSNVNTSGVTIKITSAVALTTTRTIHWPAGKFRVGFENATTGGQSLSICQPTGACATIPNDATRFVDTWNDGTNYVQVGASGGGGVASFNTRTGTVTPASGDYSSYYCLLTGCTMTGPFAVNDSSGNGGGVKGFEGTAPTAAPGVDNLWADSASHRWKLNMNNAGQLYAVGIGTPGAVNDCLKMAANGIDAVDSGIPCAGGISVKIKFISQLGCAAQNTDLNSGGGTSDTACLSAAVASATATNAILLWQDGASLIDGNGIVGPHDGNWGITGSGGGISQTNITNCSISSGVAILTAKNTLVAGQVGTLSDLTTCTSLNNARVTVLSAGLSSTQFEVAAGGSQSSVAETGRLSRAYGTGFYLADGSADAISNGGYLSGGSCDLGPRTPNALGSNFPFSNFVLNGNVQGQSNYCFGIDIKDGSDLSFNNLVLYNADKYAINLDNVTRVNGSNVSIFSTTNPSGTNTDGWHIDGNSSHIHLSNLYGKTGDDFIALNAIEGVCGPITDVTIDGVTMDNAFRFLRAYNHDKNVCANGLIPLISNVTITNVVGTISQTGQPMIFGVDPSSGGTLAPAITGIRLSNINLTSPSTFVSAISVYDNLGDFTIDGFTLSSPGSGTLMQFFNNASGPQVVGSLTLDNIRVVDTPQGSAFQSLVDFGNSGLTLGSETVSNFSVEWRGGSYTPVACLLCWGGASSTTISQLTASNIDPSHMTAVFDPTYVPSIYTNAHVQSGYNVYDSSTTSFYGTGGISTNGSITTNPAYGGAGTRVSTGTFAITPPGTPQLPTNNSLLFNNLFSGTTATALGLQNIGTNTSGTDLCIRDSTTASIAGQFSCNRGLQVGSLLVNTKLVCLADGTNCPGGGGGITGSGTTGTIPLFTGSTAVGNSYLSQTAGNVNIGGTGGTNYSLNFGTNYGALAAILYDGGAAQRYGWGLTSGTMNFVVPSLANAGGHFAFLGTGDLTGTPFAELFDTGRWNAVSGGLYGFSASSSDASGVSDTGISRESAGVVDVGNGTAGSKSGTINATNLNLTGTCTGCGSGGRGLGGGITSGSVTLGPGAGTGATIGTVGGADGNFSVAIVTGTSPSAGATIFTVTFTSSRSPGTYCIATPATYAAFSSFSQLPAVNTSGATSTFLTSQASLSPSTGYSFTFICP